MNKKYTGRYRTFAVIIALLFGVLIVQLFNLQVVDYEENLAASENKKTKTITSQGSRGTIMDANSMTLAYDKQIYNIQFYRDPNFTSDQKDENGNTVSSLSLYTKAIIDAIEIIERNGGTLNTSFSLKQDEMTGMWVFTWNTNDYTASQQAARESMWRSNFYMASTTTYPQQELFDKLCQRYKLPETLTTEEKIKVLGVWETMQNNAFLSSPITIASNVSWETVIEIEAKALTMEGISVSVSTQRVYPNGTLACHVVGYIGKIQNYDTYYSTYKDKGYSLSDLIGLDGVEKTMEDWLSPCTTQRVGKRVVEIDRYGAVSRTLSTTEASDGNNVKLTIDSNLQRIAEAALETNINTIRDEQEKLLKNDTWLDTNKSVLQGTTRDFDSNPIELAEKGAAVVIDMEGRVLALASYPPYDPNAFIVGGEAAANILLDSRNPLVNYAIGSRDTPGSIFKGVTATAGLMSGELTMTEEISDMGKYTKYDSTNPPRCWVNQNYLSRHADQTVKDALTHSCNYFFYEVGSRLYEHTDDQLYKTAALYGLTTKTGIDLPGELQGYVGSQTTLYDKNKAISASEQATWRPSIVFNNIRKNLVSVSATYGMMFDDDKLDKCVKRLMDMAVDYNQSDWLAQIRNILMEELDMPREMVYLQAITGDTYIMLNEIKWGGSEAIMCAVGQSITTVTPVALARYIAAIANGGKVYDLRIVDSIISPDGEVLSQSSPILASQLEGDNVEEYLAFIREGMKGVVEAEGTATRFFSDSKYDNIRENMGAKTGTAEKTQIDLENNAWMIAFAPFEEPEIAVCVYIPHGYSGAYCSITVREIIDYYMDNRALSQDDYMAPSNSLAY
ncbi:MAG: penicillin-binding transpeptidase domain-containing protein [Clostridiales bacterium]|nr:penicillin-binding transpeptidase domain-containing protein [Clostridiales bacterium]MDY5513943.1 penicillin-binding transpeptidase domain-containing protein [Candidatus Ventricola sp.]